MHLVLQLYLEYLEYLEHQLYLVYLEYLVFLENQLKCHNIKHLNLYQLLILVMHLKLKG